MKIAYIGIDLMFPVLEKLVACGCEVLEIFTCKTDNFTEFNTKITAYAAKNGIRLTDERITVNDFDRLKSNGCEAAFCAGYYHKIPVYKDIPTVNIHPSLLPHGKGSWPMPYYILEGKNEGGITVHKVAEGFDTGDILLQKSFALTSTDNLETYMDKAVSALCEDIEFIVKDFHKLYDNANPQGDGCYLKAPSEEMYTVTESTACCDADRIFRAFYGYECYYKSGNKCLILIKPYAVKNDKYVQNDRCIAFSLSDGYAVCEKEHVFDVN